MQTPVTMLQGSGGVKAAAVLAALFGLALITASRQRSLLAAQQRST